MTYYQVSKYLALLYLFEVREVTQTTTTQTFSGNYTDTYNFFIVYTTVQ